MSSHDLYQKGKVVQAMINGDNGWGYDQFHVVSTIHDTAKST